MTTSRNFVGVCDVAPAIAPTNKTQGAGGVITITGVFADQAAWTDEITFKMNAINPETNRPSELGFGIKTYADPDTRYMIDYLTDADYRAVLVPRLTCSHPCRECVATEPRNCQSCWLDDPSSPGFLMRYAATDADGEPQERGECRDACELGYTTDGDPDQECVPCDASCAACHQEGKAGDKDRCYLCSENHPYKLVGEPKCLARCDRGLFVSSGEKVPGGATRETCSYCEAPCAECFGTKTNCTYCDRTSALPVLMGNRCIAECPFGYTDVNGIC